MQWLLYIWLGISTYLAAYYVADSPNKLSSAPAAYLLKPAAVFDGENLHAGWAVLVNDKLIQAAGMPKDLQVNAAAQVIDLPGMTLLPGLIEGHSHLFLHPYNETPWNEQVLRESYALRTARATVHARQTLMAGFTTVRDLGTEGAGYADVGLKEAIEQGIIEGPRMIIATRALVATGSYGPKGFADEHTVAVGAEEADGVDNLVKAVRTQIGKGADMVKVYADYRWGVQGEARPTFTLSELKLIVETASSSGRQVVAHASTEEGMRRAIEAGVSTIEHGDGGTPEIFKLMALRGIALCPTLAAGDAILQYNGWKKGTDPEPASITSKKASFKAALAANVPICAGGDVGVFAHGDNVRELELMVEYGMSPLQVLRSVTSGNAKIFRMDTQIGRIKPGSLADLIAVQGDPLQQISALRQVKMVMKEGKLYKHP
jgi:imidazolonepropionase-like amidohydrolase